MMDRPTRWLYVIAAFLALTTSIDWMFRTPVGAGIWCAAMFAFWWPILRFGRPWLSVLAAGVGGGVTAYLWRLVPTVGSEQTRFVAELVVFAVMAVLGYFVLARGLWNPYKNPHQESAAHK